MTGKAGLPSPLSRTKSCRVLIPRLKTWTGERVVATKDGLLYHEGQEDLTGSFTTDSSIRRSIKEDNKRNCSILVASPRRPGELTSKPSPLHCSSHQSSLEETSAASRSPFCTVYDSSDDSEFNNLKHAKVALKRITEAKKGTSPVGFEESADVKDCNGSTPKKKRENPRPKKRPWQITPFSPGSETPNLSVPIPTDDLLGDLNKGQLLVVRHRKTVQSETVYEENGRWFRRKMRTTVENIRMISKDNHSSDTL